MLYVVNSDPRIVCSTPLGQAGNDGKGKGRGGREGKKRQGGEENRKLRSKSLYT